MVFIPVYNLTPPGNSNKYKGTPSGSINMISPKWQCKHEIKYGATILQHVLNAFTRDEILRRFKHSEHIQNLGFLAVMKK